MLSGGSVWVDEKVPIAAAAAIVALLVGVLLRRVRQRQPPSVGDQIALMAQLSMLAAAAAFAVIAVQGTTVWMALWPGAIAISSAVGLALWWRGNGVVALVAAIFALLLVGGTVLNPGFPLVFLGPLMVLAFVIWIAAAAAVVTAASGRAEAS